MFKRFLVSSFDHIFFVVSFIAGVQLPEFIQQYTQLINGRLAEAEFHLSKFQLVADQHFEGSLNQLTTRYRDNSDPAIQQMGQTIIELSSRVEQFQAQISLLTQHHYLERLYYFILNLDYHSATLTAEQYVLAIPLTIEALLTGLISATILLLIRVGLFALVGYKRVDKTQSKSF